MPQTQATQNIQKPFLLHFLESVKPCPAPEEYYDPKSQLGTPVNILIAGGTKRTQSYQNRTTSYSILTTYEDADDQYVTISD